MSIQTRNKRRQSAGRRTGRVFFVPASQRDMPQARGMFYKQALSR